MPIYSHIKGTNLKLNSSIDCVENRSADTSWICYANYSSGQYKPLNIKKQPMNIFNDKERRKGLSGTLIFHLVLLIAFVLMSMTHQIPTPINEFEINFGSEYEEAEKIPIQIPLSKLIQSQTIIPKMR